VSNNSPLIFSYLALRKTIGILGIAGYIACIAAVGLALCILLIVLYFLLPGDTAARLKTLRPVYWLEAIAIVAFGVSWFVKGESILKDEV